MNSFCCFPQVLPESAQPGNEIPCQHMPGTFFGASPARVTPRPRESISDQGHLQLRMERRARPVCVGRLQPPPPRTSLLFAAQTVACTAPLLVNMQECVVKPREYGTERSHFCGYGFQSVRVPGETRADFHLWTYLECLIWVCTEHPDSQQDCVRRPQCVETWCAQTQINIGWGVPGS